MAVITADVIQEARQQAARDRQGGEWNSTPYNTSATGALQRMRRTECHREAGTLEAVVRNAIWTEDRSPAEGNECDGVYTRCQTGEKETMVHRVWSCPRTRSQDQP
eukprot:8543917-Pyramimonas_sp.AAC.1